MMLFKLPCLARKSSPIAETNMSLASWCQEAATQTTRFVKKVEMCTALCAGEDAWGLPLGTNHHHTLLRISLAPNGSSRSADTLFIERILSTCGEHHSVTPISDRLPDSGTLYHPDVHDRTCVLSNGWRLGKHTVASHLVVERTLAFDERVSVSRSSFRSSSASTSGPCLTLAQLAQILGLVGRSTKLVCDGGDCRFQSRAFAFTCMAALAPRVPPPKSAQGVGLGVGGERRGRGRSQDAAKIVMDDSVLELSAETFLGQVPWLVGDKASMDAVSIDFDLVAFVRGADALLF